MHAALFDHPLTDLLLTDHSLLIIHSSAFHRHFTVQHGLSVPLQSLGALLQQALVLIAFPHNTIITAVGAYYQVFPVYSRAFRWPGGVLCAKTQHGNP